MTGLKNPLGERTTLSYDPNGQQVLRQLANGTHTSLIYDAGARLTQIAHRGPTGQVTEAFVYTYDDAGRRISVTDHEGTGGWYDLSIDEWANLSVSAWSTLPVGGDETGRVTWSYDPTGQLLSEHRSGANAYRTRFSYDPAGNRRTAQDLVDGVVMSTYDASEPAAEVGSALWHHDLYLRRQWQSPDGGRAVRRSHHVHVGRAEPSRPGGTADQRDRDLHLGPDQQGQRRALGAARRRRGHPPLPVGQQQRPAGNR